VTIFRVQLSRYVCAHRDIEVHNFSSSFGDGRALAATISFYQPQLISASQIMMNTTLNMAGGQVSITRTEPSLLIHHKHLSIDLVICT